MVRLEGDLESTPNGKYSFQLSFPNLKLHPVEFIVSVVLAYYKFFQNNCIGCQYCKNTVKNKPDYALLYNAVFFVLIHVWYFVFYV